VRSAVHSKADPRHAIKGFKVFLNQKLHVSLLFNDSGSSDDAEAPGKEHQ
jgi:hypothetical protein